MRFKENHIYKYEKEMYLVLGARLYVSMMQTYSPFAVIDENIKTRKDVIDYYVNRNIYSYNTIRLNSLKDLDKGLSEKNVASTAITDISGFKEVKVNKEKLDKYLTIAKMTNPDFFRVLNNLDSLDEIEKKVRVRLDSENKDFVDFAVKDFTGKIKPLKEAKRLTLYRLYIGKKNAIILLDKENNGLYVDLPTKELNTYLKNLKKAVRNQNFIKPDGVYYDTGINVNFMRNYFSFR